MTIPANAHIAAMAPYALADLSVAPGRRLVSLAQNESFRPPSPRAIEAAQQTLSHLPLYPDPDWTALREAIGEVHGIEADMILCGAGSMELIGALAAAYLGPGDTALTTQHGYLFFRTAAMLANARVDLAPERDLMVDVDAILDAVQPKTKMVLIANPGNPTGTRIGRADLVRLRDGLPESTLMVIDEAYGEFADGLDPSCFDMANRGNTVVLRTFSKAYGLAGMRVGWGVFPRPIAQDVRKLLNPNNISVAAEAAAAAAMRDQSYMKETVAETARLRDSFAKDMHNLGLSVPPSYTNFVLLRFASAEQAAAADQELRDHGILMRGMAGYGLADCLRATIGNAEDMTLAASILGKFLSGRTP